MEQDQSVVAAVTEFEERHGDHNVRVLAVPDGDAIEYICHDCDARMELNFALSLV